MDEELKEDGKECCGMLSSGHDTVVALMNSQQLWLAVNDLQRSVVQHG